MRALAHLISAVLLGLALGAAQAAEAPAVPSPREDKAGLSDPGKVSPTRCTFTPTPRRCCTCCRVPASTGWGLRYVKLRTGDTLRIPQATPHQARTGNEPCLVLVIDNTGNRQMILVPEGKPKR